MQKQMKRPTIRLTLVLVVFGAWCLARYTSSYIFNTYYSSFDPIPRHISYTFFVTELLAVFGNPLFFFAPSYLMFFTGGILTSTAWVLLGASIVKTRKASNKPNGE